MDINQGNLHENFDFQFDSASHSLLNFSVINVTRNKVQGQFSNVHEQGLSKMSKTFILDTEEVETFPVRKWKNIT